MGNEESLISVIVPIYNANKYLERCVNSILCQSYRNIELLLIDDGSKDGSAEICDQYAQKDNRVKVFHQKNGGVSVARNKGLDMMNGEYVAFIDSDDWIRDGYFSEMMKYSDYDIVACSSINTYHKKASFLFEEGSFQSKVDIKNFFIEPGNWKPVSWVVWGKLFRSTIIRKENIYFNPEVPTAEDVIWILCYFSHVNSLRILSYVGYVYVVEPSKGSLVDRPISYEELEFTLSAFREAYRSLGRSLSLNLENRYLLYIPRYIYSISSNSISNLSGILKLRCTTDPHIQAYIKENVSLKDFRRYIFNKIAKGRRYTLLAYYIKLLCLFSKIKQKIT